MSGCIGGANYSSPEEEAIAKAFSPSPGKGGLYVISGTPEDYDLSLDSVYRGRMKFNTFMYFELEPGPHELALRIRMTDYPAKLTRFQTNVEAGKCTFVKYRTQAVTIDCILSTLDEKKGTAKVRTLRMRKDDMLDNLALEKNLNSLRKGMTIDEIAVIVPELFRNTTVDEVKRAVGVQGPNIELERVATMPVEMWGQKKAGIIKSEGGQKGIFFSQYALKSESGPKGVFFSPYAIVCFDENERMSEIYRTWTPRLQTHHKDFVKGYNGPLRSLEEVAVLSDNAKDVHISSIEGPDTLLVGTFGRVHLLPGTYYVTVEYEHMITSSIPPAREPGLYPQVLKVIMQSGSNYVLGCIEDKPIFGEKKWHPYIAQQKP
jgi:hypothetical protein